MTGAQRSRALTLLAIAACWPVWLIAGWLLALLHLDALDLVGRVCAVFLFLSLAEAWLQRRAALPYPPDPA